MTAPRATVQIPEVIDRFRAYFRKNPAWASLHVVLDDANFDDGAVRHCIEYADRVGDREGADLGRILLCMSKSQRKRLATKVR